MRAIEDVEDPELVPGGERTDRFEQSSMKSGNALLFVVDRQNDIHRFHRLAPKADSVRAKVAEKPSSLVTRGRHPSSPPALQTSAITSSTIPSGWRQSLEPALDTWCPESEVRHTTRAGVRRGRRTPWS